MLQLATAPTNTTVPCSQLAAEGLMPERFLLQILRNLVTHGILKSTRGVDGGYRLVRMPEDVSLLEVIEAVDGPMKAKVPDNDGWPHESPEKLRQALQEVTVNSDSLIALSCRRALEETSWRACRNFSCGE